MVCPSCGIDTVDNFKYCPECGRRLTGAAPSPAGPSRAAPPAARVDEAAQAARLLEQAFDLYDKDRYDEALGCCQASLALDPSGSTAHSLLGMIYERLGKTAEAVQQYQLVLRMNPDSIADAIKLESLVSGQTGTGRRAVTGWRRRLPVAAAGMVAALALVAGGWATSRRLDRSPGHAGRIASRSVRTPVPGPSLPSAPAPAATGLPGAAATPGSSAVPVNPADLTQSPNASRARDLQNPSPAAALPAPPPADAWPGLRGGYPAGSHAAPPSAGMAMLPPGPGTPRRGGRDARSGDLAPAPVLGVEKIDPRQAVPAADVPGPSLPLPTGERSRSAGGSAPVLPPVTDAREARALPPAPAAATSLPSASAPPPSASISIQPLDDTAAPAPARAAPPPAAPTRPASLQDALQHEQMAAYYRRQGDNQAAYSEYQYARDLFQQVRQRGGAAGAVAAQGAAAAQTGMARLQGP